MPQVSRPPTARNAFRFLIALTSQTHAMSLLRPQPTQLAVALLMSLGLAACGGGGDGGNVVRHEQDDTVGALPAPSQPAPSQPAQPFVVSGSLTGLPAGIPLTIKINGSDSLTLPSNGPFSFTLPAAENGRYAVAVSLQPTWQHCTVKNGDGIVTGDVSNIEIRCADAEAMVSTIAGAGNGSLLDGPASSARLGGPVGIALGGDGSIYYTDGTNTRIRKIGTDGMVSSIAGSTPGMANGTGPAAQFRYPSDITVDSLGNLFVTDDMNDNVRKISPLAEVSLFAGNGIRGWADGPGAAASFDTPGGIYAESSGMILVADTYNHRIRRISPDGTVITIAGTGAQGSTDGPAMNASFKYPAGITVDRHGTIYVADTRNEKIRKISVDGMVSTLAGSGIPGTADGVGTAAQFNRPFGLVVDSNGYVYVTDRNNHKIRKVSPDGNVTTLAGTGGDRYVDGKGRDAEFYYPSKLVLDGNGDILISDNVNSRIRKLTPVR